MSDNGKMVTLDNIVLKFAMMIVNIAAQEIALKVRNIVEQHPQLFILTAHQMNLVCH